MKGIRALFASDKDAALRINAESLPGVARLDHSEFERLIKISNRHLALESPHAELVGYMLAFHCDAPYDGEEFLIFGKLATAPFIYIDQVATAPGTRRAGLATSLYEALEKHAQAESVFMLCCEVNLNPPNPVSLAFHQARGFNHTTVLETQDGRTVALMEKNFESTGSGAGET